MLLLAFENKRGKATEKAMRAMLSAGRYELETEQQAFDICDTAGRRIDSASSDFEKSQ